MGELGSIEDLYRKYGAIVLRRARAILRDSQAAKDAMQDIFMKALTAGDSFRGDASPVTWLYRATTNHCLNLIRDGLRREQLLEGMNEDSGSSGLGATEDRIAVTSVFSRVPEELREVAVYYYFDQMNHEEIAELLGVSRRTVGNRLEAFRKAALEPAERMEKLP